MAGTFGKLRAAAIAANSITQDRFTSNLSSLISAGGGPKIVSLQYSGGSDVGEFGGDTVTLNGSGFNPNANVYIGVNLANNINVVNSSTVTFTTPAANVGNYTVYLKNEDGGAAVYLPGIDYAERYPQIQASNYGYLSGGNDPSGNRTAIEKFPFSGNYSTADVGDLSTASSSSAGQSSFTNGYASVATIIDKFPFASDSNAVDIGALSVSRGSLAGHSSSENGYSSGGSTVSNVIDKFPFASDANATDVGDLTVARSDVAGISSIGMGFSGGGLPFGYPSLNVIDRFPFASDANAVDSGDLSQSRNNLTSQNSLEHGYFSGGFAPPPNAQSVDTIDKFSIASYGNATDVGNLSQHRQLRPAGHSSTSEGYTSGGYQSWPTLLPAPSFPSGRRTRVDKFPFATDSNAAQIGDLAQPAYGISGQQY
jgi:hypothetical protein